MEKLVTGSKEARDKPVATVLAQSERSYDGDVYKVHWKPRDGSPTVPKTL